MGVGIPTIPIDLINEFRKRPTRIDEGEFNRRKAMLLLHVQRLRKNGKHLENIKEAVDKGTGIKGWQSRVFFAQDLTKFEVR